MDGGHMNASGFYKLDEYGLLYGPNAVLNSNYELYKDKKDTYQYPVDGWIWFDSEEEARSSFNLPPIQQDET